MPKPKWLEPLEQTAHGCMGFGASLIFADILWYRRERVKQWPPENARLPVLYVDMRNGDLTRWSASINEVYGATVYLSSERVIDMMTDIRSYIIGSTIGHFIKFIAAGVLGYYIGKA